MDERNEALTSSTVTTGAPEWITPRRVGWALFALACIGLGVALVSAPPLFVLLALVGLICVVALFYYPFLGALAYLVFEYARVPVMFPVLQPLQVGKILVVGTLAAWFVKGWTSGRVHFVQDRVTGILALWTALGFVSCAVALDQTACFEGATVLAKWVVTYLMIILLVENSRQWHWFVLTLLLLNLKLSQFQLRSYAAGIQNTDWQEHFIHEGVGAGTTSFLANASDFGVAMVVVAPFALHLFLGTRRLWLRGLGLVSMLAFSLSILRSGSRGSAVALIAMGLMYWYRSRQKVVTGVAVVLFAAFFWTLAPPAWQERFLSARDIEADSTAASRLEFWEAGMRMMITHPLLGVGMDNFAANFVASGGDRAIAPHNIFVQAGSELGLPGLAILVALVYILYKRNRETFELSQGPDDESRYRRHMSLALEMSAVGFVVAGSFLTILNFPHLYVLLALTVSLNQVARKEAGGPT